MVSVTQEGLWMVADGIVDFRFVVKFHRSGTAIIFSFWTLREHVSYASKKLLNKQKTSSTWWVFLWKDYRCFLIELSIFWFFVKFHRSGPAIIFSFWTLREHVSYASKKLLNKQNTCSTWWVFLWKDYRSFLIEFSIFWFFVKFHRSCNNFQFFNSHRTCYLSIKKGPTQAKELINMVSATLEGLWMRIVDFQFFGKLHRSEPVIIFSFWSLTKHVSYASKNLLIKQKTSSTWCVLLWKDYVWFLIELSIIDFSSNFTGRDMQCFSGFQLSQSMLVIHQKSS